MSYRISTLDASSFERLVMNDSLVNENGCRVEMVDPGGLHELCYTVRFGEQIVYLSTANTETDAKSVLTFLKDADWTALGFPAPVGAWRREKFGGDDNPIWYGDMRYLRTSCSDMFFSPSPYTGALRRHLRIRARIGLKAVKDKNGDVYQLTAQDADGETPVLFSRGQCYIVAGRRVHRAGQHISRRTLRVDSIVRQTLGDMTQADLNAEGFASWEMFYDDWKIRENRAAYPEQAIWRIAVSPVYTNPTEYDPQLLVLPNVVLDSQPVQLALPGVG